MSVRAARTTGQAWQGRRAGATTRTRWIRGAAFGAALLLGDLVIALGIVDPRFQRLLLLALAVAALALVFRYPLAAACGVLLVVAFVIEPGRFRFPAGPIEARLEELLLGALLLVAIVRPRRAWWGGLAGASLAAFFVLVGCSGLLALGAGRAEFADAFGYSRLFAPLLLFFVIVRLFPEPRQARQLLWFAAIAGAVAGYVALAAAAPGSPLANVLNPDETASIRGDVEGLGLVNRVRLPGVAIAYVLFWYAALRAQAAQRGWPLVAWLAILAGMALSLALSFNRNMWLGLAIGFLLLLVLGRGPSRRRLTAALAVLLVGAIALTLSGPKLSSDSPLYPIIERGSTLLHPGLEARDSSLEDRRIENRAAVAAIERHPALGVGPGVRYGAFGNPWAHNQYLHLMLIAGPGALVAFLLFICVPAARALSGPPDDERLALAVGVAMTMVSSLVMISFVNASWTAVLALLAGALTILAPPRLQM